MKLLKLPTIFINSTGEEIETFQNLGIELPEIEDFMYVNPDSIDFFNEDTKGEVKLVISGESYKITMKFKQFLKLIEEL